VIVSYREQRLLVGSALDLGEEIRQFFLGGQDLAFPGRLAALPRCAGTGATALLHVQSPGSGAS
jgi:hypothetical protein